MSFYPEAILTEARRLWDEGKTTRQVAKAVGLSMGQISGIKHRHKWPGRPSPLTSDSPTRNRQRPKFIPTTYRGAKAVQKAVEASERVQRAPAPPKPPKPAYAPPKLSSVAVCQWIEGDHRGPMCCKPAVLGESWCPEHGRRVFLGRGERRLEAA